MPDNLEDLEKRIEDARKPEREAQERERRNDAQNMNVGLRAGTELVSAIAVGGFLGWLLDGWLETKPLFLIIMLLLGIVTGFVNVWRTTQGIGHAVGYAQLHKDKKQAKETPGISDDPKDKG